jgi:O-antigen ligase
MTLTQSDAVQPLSYRIAQGMRVVAEYALYAALFFLLMSKFLTNQLTAVMLVLAVISTCIQPRENFKNLFKARCVKWVLLMFVFTIAGLFYTYGSKHAGYVEFKEYAKLLFLPGVMLLARERLASRALNAFLWGVAAAMLVSILDHWGVIHAATLFSHDLVFPGVAWGGMMMYPISVSVCTAFAVFVVMHRMGIGSKWAWVYLVFILLVLYQMFAINGERTGVLAWVLLMVLFGCQRCRGNVWKMLGLTCLVMALLAAGYFGGAKFRVRANAIQSNVSSYYEKDNPHTSIGLRLAFAKNSVKLIRQKPVIGWGTGSFGAAYELTHGPKINTNKLQGDPQNSFLQYAVQYGLLGLLIYLLMMWALLKDSKGLPDAARYMLQGLLVVFVVDGMTDRTLTYHSSGFLFVLLAGALLSGFLLNKASHSQ